MAHYSTHEKPTRHGGCESSRVKENVPYAIDIAKTLASRHLNLRMGSTLSIGEAPIIITALRLPWLHQQKKCTEAVT